jgi:hypothetical protein
MKALMILTAMLTVSAMGSAQSPGSTGASGGSTGTSPSTTGLDTLVGTYGAPAGPTGTSKVGDALSNRPLNPQTGTNAEANRFAKSPHRGRTQQKNSNLDSTPNLNQDSAAGSNK